MSIPGDPGVLSVVSSSTALAHWISLRAGAGKIDLHIIGWITDLVPPSR